MTLVTLDKISKEYKMGETTISALKEVTMDIEPGTFVSIVGPSGSGKSTILNMIGCLDIATSGSIKFDNNEIGSLSKKQRAEFRGDNLGFVFQNFNLIPVLTVFENVEYPLLMVKDESGQETSDLILEMLDAVGVAEQKDKYPHQISGGQMQRVAVARAMITQPKLVIADEPTANLDHDTAYKIINLMKSMKNLKNTTFIFSTHDPKVIDEAEIIFVLEDGKITNKTDKRNHA